MDEELLEELVEEVVEELLEEVIEELDGTGELVDELLEELVEEVVEAASFFNVCNLSCQGNYLRLHCTDLWPWLHLSSSLPGYCRQRRFLLACLHL